MAGSGCSRLERPRKSAIRLSPMTHVAASYPQHMESQLTLVDLPELTQTGSSVSPSVSTVLRLTRDCAHNTTITVSGQPFMRYIVHSDKLATTTHVTRVTDGRDPVAVGSIQRRNLLPDRLTVGGADTKLSNWLKMPALSTLPATMYVHKCQHVWRFITWKKIGLYTEEAQSAMPIACFDRGGIKPLGEQYVPVLPSISLREEAEDMVDEIVLAVVILEHRLKMAEKARDTQVSSIGGGQPVPSISAQAKVLG